MNKRIPGKATKEGTQRFAARQKNIDSSHYRKTGPWLLSDLGLGTYLGAYDDETDLRYTEAISQALQSGINTIDTAINYRFQRSERSIGRALVTLIQEEKIARDEVVVATKGGFLSFDGQPPPQPMEYLEKTYFQPGIIKPQDIVAGCHSMHPNYIRHELHQSLSNLGLETIDIYYLHNVETQLEEVPRPEFLKRLADVFKALEEEVSKGRIGHYGLATWDGFRLPPEAHNHLSLHEILDVAKSVAGSKHHFQVIQLPFNLAFREAASAPTQQVNGEVTPFLRAAQAQDLTVIASAPLFQGRLLGQLPDSLQKEFPQTTTDAHRAITFVASTPGLHTALVGMSRKNHVLENAQYLQQSRINASQWKNVFESLEKTGREQP